MIDIDKFHRENQERLNHPDPETVEEMVVFDSFVKSKSGLSFGFYNGRLDWNEVCWIQRSLIDDHRVSVERMPDSFEVTMPRWLAVEKGLM